MRPATARDLPALVALVRQYWEFEELAGFEALRVECTLRRLIENPDLGALWVADEAGTLTGYLVVVHVLSLEHGGVMGEIDEFFVRPGHRGGGVGSGLLAAAEAGLRTRGGLRLQLQIAHGNAAARAWYESRGFVPRSGFELLDKPL
ncbi:MAG: GNAT family N-acetyltransferase [Proteobacteria bacterium]|nr:GNAT family N-acetyltransferase [Pseudomonadota bacterium]